MNEFLLPLQLRWSDLDPNFHLRHSVYYDWGAYCRIEFLNRYDLSTAALTRLQIGPILFREECVFRKEIRLGDAVSIDLKVLKSRPDYSRWTIQHHIYKNDKVLAAVLTVDGAWMSIAQRKLVSPPELVYEVFSQMPRAEGFELIGVGKGDA